MITHAQIEHKERRPKTAQTRLSRRQRKVASLRDKISTGSYRIDSHELAKALLAMNV